LRLPDNSSEEGVMALNKVLSFISGDNGETDSDKQILLKQIAKDLPQNKYAKFFRVKSEEIDPSFALYFYTVYKILYPAQVFFRDPLKTGKLKALVMETFLAKDAVETARRITPEAITARSRETKPVELAKQLQQELNFLNSSFDPERMTSVNQCYNMVSAISRFVLFDFVTMLSKFDTTIVEGSFLVPPKFMPVKADEDLIKDMGALISSLPPMDSQMDWKPALGVLKAARGADLIALTQWNNLIANLRDLKLSKMLELIIRYTLKNPIWDGKYTGMDERLAETWIGEKRTEIQSVINEISANQRSSQIAALVKSIFGDPEVIRLVHYNDRENAVFEQKNLEGFLYASGLNYLYAFTQDFLQKEVQELCDIILIRGQWSSNNASLEMSESFHATLEIVSRIENLDATLAESGSNSMRLKAALLRIDRDKTQARVINNITNSLDEEALELINTATQSLIVLGKHLKGLVEDKAKKHPELIINWKELVNYSKMPMDQQLAEIYKRVNYFVQLMALITHPIEE
jgi:hypothetical protein